MINTFHAVKTLHALGIIPKNHEKTVNWVHSRQQKDGGYLWDYWLPPGDPARSGLRETYYAVSVLHALNARPKAFKKLRAFLKERQQNTQRRDGSFNNKAEKQGGQTPRSVGLVSYTGMGLKILELLGLKPWNQKKTIYFLKKHQQKDGGVSKGLGIYKKYNDRKMTRMADAYYAVMGLSSLGQGIRNRKVLFRWVKKCQCREGGFSRRPDLCPPDLDATYQALFILKSMGLGLPRPRKSLLRKRQRYTRVLKYPCKQIFQNDPDELQYLLRIAIPIYNRYIGQGEFKTACKLAQWVGDNLVFCSNYKQSGALTIIDGFATCGPKARCYVSLANGCGIESRMLYIIGHGCAESKINGKWVMMDPMFYDYGHNKKGNLKSAIQIHLNHLSGGREWTVFGDFRYESFCIEKKDGRMWRIKSTTMLDEAIEMGAYGKDNY
jgi:hypothetical protein